MGFEIPVDVDYFDHPKTRFLMHLVGPEADIYPLRLWRWAAAYRKDGNLGSLPGVVEHVVGWTGKGKYRFRLILGLLKAGFIDFQAPDGRLFEGEEAEQMARKHGLLTSSVRVLSPEKGGKGETEETGPAFLGTFRIHGWMDHIGHAVALYERKKQNQRIKYAREHGLALDHLGKSSGRKPELCEDSGDSGYDTRGRKEETSLPGGGPGTPEGPETTDPAPGPTGTRQGNGHPATAPVDLSNAALEVREVDRTIGAFGYCSFPGLDAKRKAVEDLRRQGFTHAQIRAAAGAGNPSAAFYSVVRQLEKNKSNTNPGKVRENQPTERAPVLADRREDVQKRQDDGRAKADQVLTDMDPDELDGWKRDAEIAADKNKIPPALRGSWIQMELRRRAAKVHSIEGV